MYIITKYFDLRQDGCVLPFVFAR